MLTALFNINLLMTLRIMINIIINAVWTTYISLPDGNEKPMH